MEDLGSSHFLFCLPQCVVVLLQAVFPQGCKVAVSIKYSQEEEGEGGGGREGGKGRRGGGS